MNIADYIKTIRKKLGINQIELASLIWSSNDSNKKQSLISKYEKGHVIPPGNVLLKIQSLDPDK